MIALSQSKIMRILLRLSLLSEVNVFFVDRPLTFCNYYTARASVSKSLINLSKSIDFIEKQYPDEVDNKRFQCNVYNMKAHALLMNLNNRAAYYYFLIFINTFSLKSLASAVLSLVNPKLLIIVRVFQSKCKG